MDIFFLNIYLIKMPYLCLTWCIVSVTKKISCHAIYLFINVCRLCVDVTYHGKDPLINAFMVWLDRIHLYYSKDTWIFMLLHCSTSVAFSNKLRYPSMEIRTNFVFHIWQICLKAPPFFLFSFFLNSPPVPYESLTIPQELFFLKISGVRS